MKEGHNGHRKRRRPASGRDLLNVASVRPAWRYVGKCDTCGKNRFVTRAMARAAARDLHPGDPMSVYRCGNYFHYGHNSHKYAQEIGMGLRRCSDTERHRPHRWGDENDTIWHCKGEGTNGRTGDGDDADDDEQGCGLPPHRDDHGGAGPDTGGHCAEPTSAP